MKINTIYDLRMNERVLQFFLYKDSDSNYNSFDNYFTFIKLKYTKANSLLVEDYKQKKCSVSKTNLISDLIYILIFTSWYEALTLVAMCIRRF